MKIVLARTQVQSQLMVISNLNYAIRRSRFTASVTAETVRRIDVLDVRLHKSKPYCGNHPNACELGGRDARRNFLEGADWVEFNDLVNDTLDALHIDARVHTSVCVLRKGTQRRIAYRSDLINRFGRNFYVWIKTGSDADYADHCGAESSASTFPYGTPGIHTKLNYDMEG